MALPKIVQVLERERREKRELRKCLFMHMARAFDPNVELVDQPGMKRGIRLLGMSESTFFVKQEEYILREIEKYTL